VYIDLGVNWCNTLSLYKQTPLAGQDENWQVYGFEASTLIQPFVEKYFSWLNGDGPEPDNGLPPSGSSTDLARYAAKYGCPQQAGDAMRKCMWKALETPLSLLKADPRLNDTNLIENRLSQASIQNGKKMQYNFVPAAAGIANEWITLWESPQQVIRGGGLNIQKSFLSPVTVRSVDIPSWIKSNFVFDDIIIIKMDIEGAEHGILDTLLNDNQIKMIDMILWECHDWSGNCGKLRERLLEANVTVWEEGKDYNGFE